MLKPNLIDEKNEVPNTRSRPAENVAACMENVILIEEENVVNFKYYRSTIVRTIVRAIVRAIRFIILKSLNLK